MKKIIGTCQLRKATWLWRRAWQSPTFGCSLSWCQWDCLSYLVKCRDKGLPVWLWQPFLLFFLFSLLSISSSRFIHQTLSCFFYVKCDPNFFIAIFSINCNSISQNWYSVSHEMMLKIINKLDNTRWKKYLKNDRNVTLEEIHNVLFFSLFFVTWLVFSFLFKYDHFILS